MTLGYRDIINVGLAKRDGLLHHATLTHSRIPPSDVPKAWGVVLWEDCGPGGKFHAQRWAWEIGSMRMEFATSVESDSYDDAKAAYEAMGGSCE